tara:strand:- start:85 stop:1194 length:1110 start_codon:yes stop_codon:yes gene_type:complete
MHCIAQIDLAELAGLGMSHPMPDTGTLAFFADTGSFSGSDHRGTVRMIEDDAADPAPQSFYIRPLYGDDWESYDITAGSIGKADAPTVFPRWPVGMVRADQKRDGKELDELDLYTPDLDTVFGPAASSVHLDLSEFAPSTLGPDCAKADREIWPFPARVATAILKDVLRVALSYQDVAAVPGEDALGSTIAGIKSSMETLRPIVERVGEWHDRLSTLDPNAPLGTSLGHAFASDLMAWKGRFYIDNRKRLSFGSGTTTTASAALATYFQMYVGDRRSHDAIPDLIRVQMETTRMRSAYSSEAPHQLFGFGTNIQESDNADRGMILLLQVATDEAVGFMWGDVGVLQYWIAPEDLAAGLWDKVEFVMHGH